MKILKNLTVGLFSFLLFWAILIFGFFFLVNSTVMNPDFLTNRINEIPVSQLVDEFEDEFIDSESSPETEEIFAQVKEIIPNIEPAVKEGIGVAIHSFYDYLEGKKTDPEIKETIGEAFLNTEFVDSILDEINLSDLVGSMISGKTGEEEMSEEFVDAIESIVADLEPDIKEQAAEISGPVFDYILGLSQEIDLTNVLRSTVLNEDFVVPLIEKLDLSAIVGEFISDQLGDQIPPEMEFLTEYVDEAIDALEPTVKTELTEAAEPILDYLMGDASHISIEISLGPVIDSLEDNLREELLAAPPPEYAGLSQSELNELFDDLVGEQLTEILPENFEIDESMLGPEIVSNFTGAITDAEQNLTEIRDEIDSALLEIQEPLENAREYVSYFQLAYTLLLVFIGLMVLGIVLILRDVKAICRRIGVPLLIYGAIEYAGIWAGRYFLNSQTLLPEDIPAGVESMVFDISNSVMRPLEIFSLALLIIGLVLTVVSFVYRRDKKLPVTETDTAE